MKTYEELGHAAWFDARQAASEASMECGFAWLVPNGAGGWTVVPGDTLDDSPAAYAAEFISGVEQ